MTQVSIPALSMASAVLSTFYGSRRRSCGSASSIFFDASSYEALPSSFFLQERQSHLGPFWSWPQNYRQSMALSYSPRTPIPNRRPLV